jgi:polar amino acid transport system permease protein
MDVSVVIIYVPQLLAGTLTTIEVAAGSILLASILGLAVGLLRAAKRRWLYLLLGVYVEFFRSIPTLVMLFLVYFSIPIMLGFDIPSFPAAVLALGVAGSAYMAEIVRGGVESIVPTQWEAAYSLGMRYPAVVRYVVLPQALRVALPPAVSLYVALIKDCSLVLLVGVVELTAVSMNIRGTIHGRNTLGIFLVMAALYFVLCYTVAFVGQQVERRLQV